MSKRELKSKFIINNYSDLTDYEVLDWLLKIVKMGRISNDGKLYANLSLSDYKDKSYQISTYWKKDSDRFKIFNVPTEIE